MSPLKISFIKLKELVKRPYIELVATYSSYIENISNTKNEMREFF